MEMSLTDTRALAGQLERRVALLSRWLRAIAQPGMSVAALLTLRRLELEGPMRISDLAAAEAVAQPTMTGLIARLEGEGLVRRSRDRDDARAVRAALTAAGRKRLDRVRSARASALQTRLDTLADDDLAALAAALPALDQLISMETR